MTTDDEILALCDAATPGPWEWHPYMGDGSMTLAMPQPGFHELNILKTTSDWPPNEADAAFIAACSPETVRSLVVRAQTAERWKAEAIEVIYGLQELGTALGIPLGERITGPVAVEAAERLVQRAQTAEAERGATKAAMAVKSQMHHSALEQIAAAEAQLAALVAGVKGLADEWDDAPGGDEWDAAERWHGAPAELRALLPEEPA